MSDFTVGLLTNSQIYNGLVGTSQPDDYHFSLSEVTSLNIALGGSGADLQLLDSSGNLLQTAASTGTGLEVFDLNNLMAGEYVIRVFSVNGDTNYNLNLAVDKTAEQQSSAGVDSVTGLPSTQEMIWFYQQKLQKLPPNEPILTTETPAVTSPTNEPVLTTETPAVTSPTNEPVLTTETPAVTSPTATTTNLSSETIPTNFNPFVSGTFKVDDTGQVGIDYLFDGGKFRSELAIFSMKGMENFVPGTPEFNKEVARRALSNSAEGYVVISKATEGARFTGQLGEQDWNGGRPYQGVKSFLMNPGDEFGVMMVPNATVKQVFDNPAIGGYNRPLFSMATANPVQGFHLGQIADITGEGNTFSMEDMRFDSWTDRDYNDLIFQVRGAVAKTALMNDVVGAGKDWRTSDLGQALVEYAKAYITPEEPVVNQGSDVTNNSGNDGVVSPDLPINEPVDSGSVSPDLPVEAPVDSSGSVSPDLPVEAPINTGSVSPDLPVEGPVDSGSINKPIEPTPASDNELIKTSPIATPATDEVTKSQPVVTTPASDEVTKSSSITTPATLTETTNNLPTESALSTTEVLTNQPVGDNKSDVLTGNQLSESTGVIGNVETSNKPVYSGTVVKDSLTGESQTITNSANNVTPAPVKQPSITALAPSPVTFEFPKQKQPLTGIIAAEQSNSAEISKINKNALLWSSSTPVASENLAQSLVEFVDAAKQSGQPNAIINISQNLTTTNADGSV